MIASATFLCVSAVCTAPLALASPVATGTWFHHGLQLKLNADGSAAYVTCEGAGPCANKPGSWVSSGPSSVRITLAGGGTLALTANAPNRGTLVTADGSSLTMCGPGDMNTDGYCGA